MKVDIRHSPAYAVARCFLAPHEAIKVQPGAMMAHSFGVTLTAKADGGFMKGLGKMMGGESFHTTVFTAPAHGGWVDVISNSVGDVVSVGVDNATGFRLTKGAWLANDGNLDVGPDASLNGMFSGSGLIVLRVNGQGNLLVSSYGALDVISLKAGEGFTLDTGHLVGWESSVQMRTRKSAGILNSIKSGEGLVVDLQGPGDVIMQTRVFSPVAAVPR
ncbi:TIGR00266 family protein [Arthrobacter zhaoxinii]|uniref:TIGR00266 family protein n=1 Tax=Arthrobacter zhaoxinii TaxID=2964616 RepID=A0ABY5YQ18_9MICC|nr:TIGR00266 family protein [Arthrobacter zhaoxinii]UWX97177.1 TIGR00266 family protein [Arthrobacter zhaoxinii]